ncbi:hypothetical protein CEUSTIGMA_g6288.t1 [Chlamydomonas eustigma]|uniref:Retrotransposon gag domain-containing protein n=1 Tax=Chlamydomonas eustigma TaxID=1157962 RepID=A0A250X7V9_9CHLO|nr:hypothetical protein CEUSTIGMA_g6288.t1 [Chlamydomonas eustigma]|eukprot:GAX78850.1 hypothetical protein CEUSTIGMA_g6288.t1 [Chlamydomonas eustigma]
MTRGARGARGAREVTRGGGAGVFGGTRCTTGTRGTTGAISGRISGSAAGIILTVLGVKLGVKLGAAKAKPSRSRISKGSAPGVPNSPDGEDGSQGIRLPLDKKNKKQDEERKKGKTKRTRTRDEERKKGKTGHLKPLVVEKWPTPGKMGVPLFKSVVSKPHILDNEVEGICAWLRAHHLPIPDHLPHFIEDYDVKDFVKSYFKSLPVDVPFIEEDFKTSLKRFVSGEVRSQVAIARATLVGRELKQGPDSAAKYAQRFFQCSRLIPDECQVSLCLHYLAGLNPELKQACTLDRDGNERQSLSSLVKYSYGEELRLNARSAAHAPSRPVFRPSSQGFQSSKGRVAAIQVKRKASEPVQPEQRVITSMFES